MQLVRWLILAALLVGAGIATWRSKRATRTKLSSIFGARDEISVDQLTAGYRDLGGQPELASEIWRRCASILEVPETRLRPTDRFDTELAPVDYLASVGDRRDELTWYAMDFAKARGKQIDLQ